MSPHSLGYVLEDRIKGGVCFLPYSAGIRGPALIRMRAGLTDDTAQWEERRQQKYMNIQ